MKTLLPCLPALLLVACGPVKDQKEQPPAPDRERQAPVADQHPAGTRFHPVKGLSHQIMGNREVMTASVNGREITATLTWRPYRADLDGEVATWYGDMTRPPPRFVVDSLTLSVDATALSIPRSRIRSLCSQRATLQPQFPTLLLFTSGSYLGLTVDVGDGASSWTGSYLVDPSPPRLLSHQIEDAGAFHNVSVDY